MHKPAPDAATRATLLTTREVASLIKVDKSTIYRMAEAGRLPAVKVGRQWRFPEDRLLAWLGRRPAPDGRAADAEAGGRPLLSPAVADALAGLLGELLGVMVVLTDMEGRPLAEPGNPCGLFTAAHRYPGVLERCTTGWREMAAEPDLEPRWQVTPLGFLCARSLVRVGDQLKGMVLVGGVAPAPWPPSPQDLELLAAGLEVPVQSLEPHVEEVHRLTAEQQDAVLHLLPRLGALVSRLIGSAPPFGHDVGQAATTFDHERQRSDQ